MGAVVLPRSWMLFLRMWSVVCRSCVLNTLLCLAVLHIPSVNGQPRHGEWTHDRCLETYAGNRHLHDVKTYPRRQATHHAHSHHRVLHHFPEEVRSRVPNSVLHHYCTVLGYTA